MKVSRTGLELIKRWEGLGDGDKKLPGLQPYMDPIGLWTIGYGHLITVKGKSLKGELHQQSVYNLYNGGITQRDADTLLALDVEETAAAVERLLIVPTKQCEFDVLVSLAFNIGIGNFRKSSVLSEHNRNNKLLVPARIRLYNKAGGKVLKGLVRRREEEARIYSGGK